MRGSIMRGWEVIFNTQNLDFHFIEKNIYLPAETYLIAKKEIQFVGWTTIQIDEHLYVFGKIPPKKYLKGPMRDENGNVIIID